MACLGYAEKYNLHPVLYTVFMDNNQHTTMDHTIIAIKTLFPTIDISSEVVNQSGFDVIQISGDDACRWIPLRPPRDIMGRVLLKGYFQSEKYFPSEKYLATHFKKYLPDKKIYTNPDIDPDQCHFFIHVRCGDYVGNYFHEIPQHQLTKYYQTAINQILAIKPAAVFHIFTNAGNIEQIRHYFQVNSNLNLLDRINYRFMSEYTSEQDPLSTLEAMARIGGNCNGVGGVGGGIGVNSSFSWMAAYLARRIWQSQYYDMDRDMDMDSDKNGNSNQERPMFFLPRRWFNCLEYDRYKDIFPTWAKIIGQ